MSVDRPQPPDERLDAGELLSAYLDDELMPDERDLVEQALVSSPALRRELDELRATQSMLRALPLVEPVAASQTRARMDSGSDVGAGTPSPAAEPRPTTDAVAASDDAAVVSLDRHRRRRRRTAATLGAVAAALLVVLGIGATLDPMPTSPAVDEFAAAHMGSVGGFSDMDAEAMDDPAVLDDLGDDMGRMAVYARDDLIRTVYSDGLHEVSVFHEPGIVDWEALPADGVMIEDGETKTWTGTRDEAVVAVAERGDLMVVVVADATMGTDAAMDKATEAVSMVPPVRIERGLWQRVSDAPANLIDRI